VDGEWSRSKILQWERMNIPEKPIPEFPLTYKTPWFPMATRAKLGVGIQKELEKEIGPLHPLFPFHPVAFAKSGQSDDILAVLNDGRFAFVHLVWHGHIDSMPTKFPVSSIVNTLDAVQAEIDRAAAEYLADE